MPALQGFWFEQITQLKYWTLSQVRSGVKSKWIISPGVHAKKPLNLSGFSPLFPLFSTLFYPELESIAFFLSKVQNFTNDF
jgi:hypothetical protein